MFCRKTILPFGSHQAPLYRGSQQNRLQGNPQRAVSYERGTPVLPTRPPCVHPRRGSACLGKVTLRSFRFFELRTEADTRICSVERQCFLSDHIIQGDISPHVRWTPVLLSEALLVHNVFVCFERPSGALPPASEQDPQEFLAHQKAPFPGPTAQGFLTDNKMHPPRTLP